MLGFASFLSVGLAISFVNQKEINPECGSEQESELCAADCETGYIDCLGNCGSDSSCISNCARSFATCSELCPCYTKCYNGCPCSYASEYCDSDTNSIDVLVFNPFWKSGESQIIFSWNFENSENPVESVESIELAMPDEFDDKRFFKCSFQLNNEMYIIGGDSYTDKDYDNYRVRSTGVEKLDNLPFSFNDGRCANYDGKNVLACAANGGHERDCWNFDGDNWTEVGQTRQKHWQGDIASYHNQAVIVGKGHRAGKQEY